jgi:hypothetical protein
MLSMETRREANKAFVNALTKACDEHGPLLSTPPVGTRIYIEADIELDPNKGSIEAQVRVFLNR